MLRILNFFRGLPSDTLPFVVPHPVVTDVTVCSSACELDHRVWHRVEKDLYSYTLKQSAWLYVALANEKELVAEDLLVTDIRVGEAPSGGSWEGRPGGIWICRNKFLGNIEQVVTEVDVLFGMDAVEPRPQWALMQPALQLDAPPNVPVAKLTVLHGRVKPRQDKAALRVREDGRFKIVQVSDTHMSTGVGTCKDAIDAHGKHLPESEADPLTVDFMAATLDTEKPDLVILTGDQLHHDISDSQSALFKVVAPIIERSIPFAAVFGNHDSEGIHALSRAAQMSILQDLPYSLCEPGPEQVDGIGNYYLQILGPTPSQLPLSTLYLLDSHGQIPSKIFNHGYEAIKQSQIDWFVEASQAQKCHMSLAFFHIPLPEFGDSHLSIYSGHRREPTESPSFNSHFYDALAKQGMSAVGCGHDHVNDFCARLPMQQNVSSPWLCYGGGAGFGGYGSYGRKRFHRRMRVWELDTSIGSLNTWERVKYAVDRVDELVLVEGGEAVAGICQEGQRRGIVSREMIIILAVIFLASATFLLKSRRNTK